MDTHKKTVFVLFLFICGNQTLRADEFCEEGRRRVLLKSSLTSDLHPVVCTGEIGVTYNLTLNTTREYIFEYTKEKVCGIVTTVIG